MTELKRVGAEGWMDDGCCAAREDSSSAVSKRCSNRYEIASWKSQLPAHGEEELALSWRILARKVRAAGGSVKFTIAACR